MRLYGLYILFCITALCRAQAAFTAVRQHMAVQDMKRAATLLDSCYAKNYYHDSVLYYRGLLELRQENMKAAKKYYRDLGKAFPAFKDLHYLGGLIAFSDGNYGKSIDELGLAIKENPANAKALYNRALAFGMIEEYLSAIEDLTACLALKPDYALAYYSRAYWFEYTGNYVDAAKDYEATIRSDPKNYDAYFGLAYVLQNQNENNKACEAIDRAIKEGSQIAVDFRDKFCH